jgi:hypothetical protein
MRVVYIDYIDLRFAHTGMTAANTWSLHSLSDNLIDIVVVAAAVVAAAGAFEKDHRSALALLGTAQIATGSCCRCSPTEIDPVQPSAR